MDIESLSEFVVFQQTFKAIFLSGLMLWGIIYGARRIDRNSADWRAYPWVVAPILVAILITVA